MTKYCITCFKPMEGDQVSYWEFLPEENHFEGECIDCTGIPAQHFEMSQSMVCYVEDCNAEIEKGECFCSECKAEMYCPF